MSGAGVEPRDVSALPGRRLPLVLRVTAYVLLMRDR